MRVCILSVVFTAVIPGLVAAQPPANLPTNQGPILEVVGSVDQDKGELEAYYAVQVPVMVTKQVVKTIDGQEVVEQVAETVLRREVRAQRRSLAAHRFIDGAGKEVAEGEALKRLRPGAVILVSPTPQVEPAYLEVYDDRVLILVPKAE